MGMLALVLEVTQWLRSDGNTMAIQCADAAATLTFEGHKVA